MLLVRYPNCFNLLQIELLEPFILMKVKLFNGHTPHKLVGVRQIYRHQCVKYRELSIHVGAISEDVKTLTYRKSFLPSQDILDNYMTLVFQYIVV